LFGTTLLLQTEGTGARMRTIRTPNGRQAAPVYAYDHKPGEPPVSTFRLDRHSLHGIGPGHAHSHDFLVLAYFQRG